MKTLSLSLLALGLLAAVAPLSASAQATCQTSFDLVGTDANVWTIGGATNPTITACPGQEITFNVDIQTGTHNLQITPGGAVNGPWSDGEVGTVTYTAPASGTGQYVCTIHASTMKGTINFGAPSTTVTTTPAADNKNESPGFEVVGLALAGVAAALLYARRK